MSDATQPALSVVLVTDEYERVRAPVRHLAGQSDAASLELVLAVERGSAPDLAELDLQPFHSVQLVEVDGVRDSLDRARAEAIRAARARVVAFTETHVFTEPGWARALIETHRQGYTAVGPTVMNANPLKLLSWAGCLLDYGPWLHPAAPGPTEDLPGHNSSYERELLLAYGSKLEPLLETEMVLNHDLRANGQTLYLQPAARIRHVNVTRVWSTVVERVTAGKRFAAARARSWPLARRAAYALGSPLIPAIRLPRLLRCLSRCERAPSRARLIPVLLFSLAASALGEFLGYAFGLGDTKRRLAAIELDKRPHLASGDRVPEAGW